MPDPVPDPDRVIKVVPEHDVMAHVAFVCMTVGGREIALTIDDARELALNLLTAAEGAITDHFLAEDAMTHDENARPPEVDARIARRRAWRNARYEVDRAARGLPVLTEGEEARP